MPNAAFAESAPQVLHASNIEEYIDATNAGTDYLISVDKKTGEVDGDKSFEDVFGKDFEAASDDIKAAIEEDDLYVVTDENRNSIEALSVFGTRRIKVRKEISSLEGAKEGVCYNGNTLLSYRTIEDTQAAFRRLVDKYGADNVIPDLPVISAMSNSWGMDYMNLDDEKNRRISEGANSGNKVTVAVLDSGINANHEVFRGTGISPHSKSIVDSSGSIDDDTGHGTMVSGIIAETTPDNVELMIIKVFANGGLGSTEDINQAVAYAADNGADVINMSMGSCLYETLNYLEVEGYNPQVYMNELEEQLKYAALKRSVICTAAGNEGRDIDTFIMYPAYSRFTLTVGSIDNSGARSSFSNYGTDLDFCAPGSDIAMASNTNNSGYESTSGTSFATPYVSACCAYLKMQDRSTTVTSARNTLKTIAVDLGPEGWDKYYGWGMPHYEDFENGGTTGDDDEIQDQAAADEVITLINALPAADSITVSDRESIESARAAYENLTDSQKDRIEPYTLKKLTDAEKALSDLMASESEPDEPADSGEGSGGTAAPPQAQQAALSEITVDAATVDAAAVQQALQAAGYPDTLILGRSVKKIRKGALAGTGIKTVVVTTKKLKKKSVKGSLKGSGVTTVRINVGSAKTNKKYTKKYKKIFTKKNAGKKVRVKKF